MNKRRFKEEKGVKEWIWSGVARWKGEGIWCYSTRGHCSSARDRLDTGWPRKVIAGRSASGCSRAGWSLPRRLLEQFGSRPGSVRVVAEKCRWCPDRSREGIRSNRWCARGVVRGFWSRPRSCRVLLDGVRGVPGQAFRRAPGVLDSRERVTDRVWEPDPGRAWWAWAGLGLGCALGLDPISSFSFYFSFLLIKLIYFN